MCVLVAGPVIWRVKPLTDLSVTIYCGCEKSSQLECSSQSFHLLLMEIGVLYEYP